MLDVIDSPKASKALLRPPSGSTSNAYGKLFSRSDLADVVAMAARLPQPPTGQAYHLWLTSGGQTRLAGVLSINDQGFGLLTFKADHAGPVYESAQLTLQSLGATTPTTPAILTWSAPS